MIRLINWYISEHIDAEDNEKFYIAWGNVVGHPKLSDGMHIHTSMIKSLLLDNNSLIMITNSDNKYELKLSDISINDYPAIEGYVSNFNISMPSLDECKRCVKIAEDVEKENVFEVLNDGELYLKFVGDLLQRAYWKNGDLRAIPVHTHLGMFQDSYLVIDSERNEVDFRYFNDYSVIKPYHYSDGLKTILIHNKGTSTISFADGDYCEDCKPNKVIRLESNIFHSEGLFSPDVVNGKSLIIDV